MVSLLTRMSIGTIIVVVIAEAVEWWHLANYPEQWLVVPLIMFFTVLVLIVNLWRLLLKYKISK